MSNGRTTEQILNAASVPLQTVEALGTLSGESQDAGFGQILRGMVPGLKVRTGLTSQAAHVETPGRVYAVTDEAGAVNLTIIAAGAPAGTQVLVTYADGSTPAGQDKGTPTLTFNAAVTGYQVEKGELPVGFDEALSAIYV